MDPSKPLRRDNGCWPTAGDGGQAAETGQRPQAGQAGESGQVASASQQTPGADSTASLGTGLGDRARPPHEAPRPHDEVREDAETVIRKPEAGSSSRSSGAVHRGTPVEIAKVLLGSQLSHFHLEELIGGGGMGAVFRARDERLDRVVAIKVLPFRDDDPDLQRRFRNEAQAAARLDHPGIARVFDVGMFQGWRYIVFEYIEGINLRDLVERQGVLSIEDAVLYTLQIAEALHHASGRGVVHRDVKPSNILVNIEGDTKLVDMGLARSDSWEISGDMTASGVTLGTFDYISPEQAHDPRQADVRSDIYSLGCTLYYMLTGLPPYPGGTVLQKLLNHGNAAPPDAAPARPDASQDLLAIMRRMLAKAPKDRYQRAIDLVADLRELARREGLSRVRSRGTLAVVPEDQWIGGWVTHLPWLVGVTLLFLVAGLLQAFASLRDETWIEVPGSVATLRSLGPTDQSSFADPRPPAEDSPSSSGATDRPDPGGRSGGRDGSERPPERRASGEQEIPMSEPGEAEPRDEDDRAQQPPKFDIATLPEVPSLEPAGEMADADAHGDRIVKIVVGAPAGAASSETVGHAESLAEALQLADRWGVSIIEIAVPVIETPPLRIPRDGLTIRSVVGMSEIRFLDTPQGPSQSAAMFDVGSHRIDLENLHFSWQVPERLQSGSLLAISRCRMLRLTGCTITIDNHRHGRPDIYALEIAGTSGDGISATAALPQVALEFKDFAARGEMTLVNVVDPVELHLRWENGLLAVSRRLLELPGTANRQQAAANPISLSLRRVTASMGRGMVRTRLGPGGRYPMLVDRESRSGVFRSPELSPLFEVVGLDDDYHDPQLLLSLRGQENAYDYDQETDWKLLVMSFVSGMQQNYWLSQFLIPSRPPWFTEELPRWLVQWQRPPDDSVPASRLRVVDFLQLDDDPSGLEAMTLPEFPVRETAFGT